MNTLTRLDAPFWAFVLVGVLFVATSALIGVAGVAADDMSRAAMGM
jgi:hypothetical protein